jgi:hypothetical protein
MPSSQPHPATITLALDSIERKRVLYYSEQSLSEKSHWGDGDFLIPEEQNILDQCRLESHDLSLTWTQARILFSWFFRATGEGSFVNDTDAAILNKLLWEAGMKSSPVNEKIEFLNKRFFPEYIPSSAPIVPQTPITEEINPPAATTVPGPPDILDLKIARINKEIVEAEAEKSAKSEPKILEATNKTPEDFIKNAEKILKGKKLF